MTSNLIAFLVAAGLLTLTPGIDTAMVLRTATDAGPRRAAAAAVGIGLGCLVWGAAVALGLAALLAASAVAFTGLKIVGAAYLVWLGIGHLRAPRGGLDAGARPAAGAGPSLAGAFRRGLFANLLNPKIGVFYVTFLPQFAPRGADVGAWCLMLAGLHVAMTLLWFATLIAATAPLGRALARPAVVRALDRITGCVFIGFGVRLALAERP